MTQVQRAVKGQENLAFAAAAAEFAAPPGNTQSIAEMMRLALEGICPDIRQRARVWLRRVGVNVVDEGVHNAVKATATGLRR